MKKALITGITGQDGSYLADLLIAKGYEVHGSGEEATFGEEALFEMLRSGRAGIERLLALQEEVLTVSAPQ